MNLPASEKQSYRIPLLCVNRPTWHRRSGGDPSNVEAHARACANECNGGQNREGATLSDGNRDYTGGAVRRLCSRRGSTKVPRHSISGEHGTVAGAWPLPSLRSHARIGLSRKSDWAERGSSRDWPMDGWRLLLVCHGDCVRFSGRLRSWSIPAAGAPRRWHIRRQRDVPNRSRADLDRTGSACAVFGISPRLQPHADSVTERGVIATGLVLVDARRDWTVCSPLSLGQFVRLRTKLPATPQSAVHGGGGT